MNPVVFAKSALIGICALLSSAAVSADGQAQIPSADAVPIALLVDVTSGQVLFERNADRRFVPASITKVMTTFTAFELISSGDLRRDEVYTFDPDAFRRWGGKGSTMFLGANARVSVDQLLQGITTVSANDGSVVLAEGAVGSVEEWTALMNRYAREIGMRNSHFANPNGWMDEGQTFVTARDLSRLASAMINRHPELYHRYVGKSEYRYDGITQTNHDPLIGVVRGADGIKTGFTYESGFGYLGSAEREGRRLVMVVGGADTGRVRQDAAREFMEWGFEAFERQILFAEGESVGAARVQNGSAFSVPLYASGPVAVSLPRNAASDYSIRIEYEGPLRAPIKAEEVVAELVVSGEGMPEARIPLHAGETIDVAGPLDRMLNAVMSWFT